jgi:glutamate transport system permease protein
MTAVLLGDDLGPRGRRRVLIGSAIATVLVVALLSLIYRRLESKGQLEWRLWEPFTQWSVFKFLLLGMVNTLKAALTSIVLAIGIAGLMALGRLARSAPIRWLAGVYVEFFRAVPLLLLILFTGLGLPQYGFDLSVFWYLVMALTAYNSAVMAEIFRSGILSLDRGQSEAALAIGLTYWQSMLLVVIPQAIRRMIPATVSQLVTLLKDTSLGFVITYEELLRRGRQTGEFFRNPLQSFVVVAVMYIVVNFALSRVARRLEVRQRRRYKAGAINVAGVEDLAVVAAHGESKI